MKSVVVFCGGRGARSLVHHLKDKVRLVLVVNAYDDGLSTGEVRRLLNILGPSDIRKNIPHLAPVEVADFLSKLLEDRLEDVVTCDDAVKYLASFISLYDGAVGSYIAELAYDSMRLFEPIKGEPLKGPIASGNLILASMFKGNIQGKIDRLLNSLSSRHRIVLNSTENRYLIAQTRSLRFLFNEGDIVAGRSNSIVRDLRLVSRESLGQLKALYEHSASIEEVQELCNKCSIHPEATSELVSELSEASLIIYSPGTVNSSIYPTMLTNGLGGMLSMTNSKKVLISNIGADYETPDYRASDYPSQLYRYLARTGARHISDVVDTAFVNVSRAVGSFPSPIVFDKSSPIWEVVDPEVSDYEDCNNKGMHSNLVYDVLYDKYLR